MHRIGNILTKVALLSRYNIYTDDLQGLEKEIIPSATAHLYGVTNVAYNNYISEDREIYYY